MPYKDPDRRREHQKAKGRKWYEEHRELTIERSKERKKEYGGKCVVCGKATSSASKNWRKPRFCKDHRKELWEEKQGKRVFEEMKAPPKHSEEQREYWREAKKKQRSGLKGATPDVPKSNRRSALKRTQERLAQSSYKGPAFSRLKHISDHAQDEKNENPPTSRKWASP